jgi:hypothetical protein
LSHTLKEKVKDRWYMGKRDVEKESFMGRDWAVKALQWYQN